MFDLTAIKKSYVQERRSTPSFRTAVSNARRDKHQLREWKRQEDSLARAYIEQQLAEYRRHHPQYMTSLTGSLWLAILIARAVVWIVKRLMQLERLEEGEDA